MRGMSTAEMAAVYQPTIDRANQIFNFMRDQPRVNDCHQATQELMCSVLGGNFAQYTNPIRYLLGKNALLISNSGPPMFFALIDNSGFWQAGEVAAGRLEDRGQCHGITKAGNRCKVGQKTSSVLYISWRDTDGKCYCKRHAPATAVHMPKSQFKWKMEAEKAQAKSDATSPVIIRNRRNANQDKMRAIHQAATAAGLERPRLMGRADWNTHLKGLVKSGELTLPEPTPDLELEQDAIVAATPEPEPVVEEPTPDCTDSDDWTLARTIQEAQGQAQDGVWIDGVRYVSVGTSAVPLDVDVAEELRLLEESNDNSTVRIQNLEQAILDYCNGDTTRKQLRDVVDNG